MTRSAVIFDLDGTLTRPYLDFDAIRAEIGIAAGPILEAMERMTPVERRRAEEILSRHEWDAARHGGLYDGAVEVVAECRRRGFPTAVMTRNARAIVDHIVATHGFVFDVIRTREDGAIKPSAEPVYAICDQLGAATSRSWVVGDFLFDIQSGRAAGSRTVLMIGESDVPEFAHQADHVIRELSELLALIDGTLRA